MRYRTFGRTGWQVSEIGYGMWGMGGWTGSDDDESRRSLQTRSNWAATSSTPLGLRRRTQRGVAGRAGARELRHSGSTPRPRFRRRTLKWPSRRGFTLDETFPPDHIREYTRKASKTSASTASTSCSSTSGKTPGRDDERWQRAVDDLKREGLIGAIGISINRWEPWNALETLRTGLIDAVQVIYNIFDQAPEDELFPLCRELRHRRHRARAVR